jgi:hypothetical protein
MFVSGVTGSIPIAPTTHPLRLYNSKDARDSAAISKTCLPNSLTRAVSGLAFTANEPNSASRLCIDLQSSVKEIRRSCCKDSIETAHCAVPPPAPVLVGAPAPVPSALRRFDDSNALFRGLEDVRRAFF